MKCSTPAPVTEKRSEARDVPSGHARRGLEEPRVGATFPSDRSLEGAAVLTDQA